MEQPCVLCLSKDDDELIFGKVHKQDGVVVHCNCLYLSSNLVQNGNERQGILSFLKKDIMNEVRRCRMLRCFYCQRFGATIGCCRSKCRRTFHTKCGYDNLAVSQFSGRFNSFCHQHVPKYPFRPRPAELCMICFESLVPARKRFSVATSVQSPCCRNGWYHRQCLQKYANSAGYFFKCPLCKNGDTFGEVSLFGISIPNSDAAWELEPNAFADQLQRPEHCTSVMCRIRPGTNRDADSTDLLYCIMCGSNPKHTACTSARASTYRCEDCIGVTPSGSAAADSDAEADVFERLAEMRAHRRQRATSPSGLNDTRDLRHSKLVASMRVSSESDDDDEEEDFDKVCRMLNETRQPRAKPAHEASSSSAHTATNRRMRPSTIPEQNENETDDDEDDFDKVRTMLNQTRAAKPASSEASSSSAHAPSGRPVGRASRKTLPNTRPEHNESGKAKKRRGSSRSPVAEPESRRFLQPISPQTTAARSNLFVAGSRRRRTMPHLRPRHGAPERFNMNESCVANRTRTRLPAYLANKK
ncbi:hypothetical protein KR054_002673 [Drosophila jambulina]|nr:hypothetical protein KR054_002673 [Drosophila jambulina]